MTRLPVVLLPVAAVAAAAIALFGLPPSTTPARGASRPAASTMRMPMPAARASAASKTRTTFELHRSVVHLKILNFAFTPNRLVVSRGTHVVWTNEDSEPHTVTTDHGAFASQALNTGGKYTLVARRTGTFTYHCQIHPFMHGTLVVQG